MTGTNIFSTVYVEKETKAKIDSVIMNGVHSYNAISNCSVENSQFINGVQFSEDISNCTFINCRFEECSFNDMQFINCNFINCILKNNIYTFLYGGSTIFSGCSFKATHNYDLLHSLTYEKLLDRAQKRTKLASLLDINLRCNASEIVLTIPDYDKQGRIISTHNVVFERIERGIYQFFHDVKSKNMCTLCANDKSHCTCNNNTACTSLIYTLNDIKNILKIYKINEERIEYVY